jgi:ketosteroid isomerase-like protein
LPNETQAEQEKSVDAQRNKDVVEQFEEMVCSGDAGQLDELCTPDMVNHSLAPGRPSGIEGTRQLLNEVRFSGRAGRWLHSRVVAENDMVIQFGVREAEWAGSSFRGFSTPSGHYTADAAFVYRLVDGRIAERWAVRDDLAMLIQLGALTPSPVMG